MSALDRVKTILATAKGKALIVAGTVSMTMVQYASAGNITDGISPVIIDVTELLPLMLALVIAALPIIVALAVCLDVKVSEPVDRVPLRAVRWNSWED